MRKNKNMSEGKRIDSYTTHSSNHPNKTKMNKNATRPKAICAL